MRPLLLIALLLVAALPTACGSATDYRGRVRAVQARYEARLADLTTRATTELRVDRTAAAADLARLASTMTAFADEVEALPPPVGQEALAGRLVEAYRTMARATGDLRRALLVGDARGVQAAVAAFQRATQLEQGAVDAFNAT
jgi:hypothetical protein